MSAISSTYWHSPPLNCWRVFLLHLVQHLAYWVSFTVRKLLKLQSQEKQRTSQQRGNMSARADVPLLRWRPVPQSPKATEPNFCSVPWQLFFFFFLLLCLLAPVASFFFFLSWQGGLLGSFGTVQVPWSYQKSRSQPRPGYGGEEKEPGAAACSIQETGKVAPVTAVRLGFTHTAGGGEECRNKRAENAAAAVFKLERDETKTLHWLIDSQDTSGPAPLESKMMTHFCQCWKPFWLQSNHMPIFHHTSVAYMTYLVNAVQASWDVHTMLPQIVCVSVQGGLKTLIRKHRKKTCFVSRLWGEIS